MNKLKRYLLCQLVKGLTAEDINLCAMDEYNYRIAGLYPSRQRPQTPVDGPLEIALFVESIKAALK
jgi:hypothetical protein